MESSGGRRSARARAPRLRAVALAVLLAGAGATGVLRANDRLEPLAPVAVARVPTRYLDAVLAPSGAAEADWAPSATWELANLENERVNHWIEVFTTNRKAEFSRQLARMGRYGPMITEKLEERGMPRDLIFLALIESGFNPKAYSPAAASGLWQFVVGTAKLYDLDVNRAVDERNDPEKATVAALDHLDELYDRFGSWYLAAAAYNSGQNRVARVMREVTGSEKGTDESFYRIAESLPRETREYVPLLIAAARIAKEPARYGFGEVEMEKPLAYREVVVEPATPLARVAQSNRTTVAEIRELNPQLKLERTRSDERSVVRVPAG